VGSDEAGVKLFDGFEGAWVIGYSLWFLGLCVGAEKVGNGSCEFHEEGVGFEDGNR
jgi:hypothetical protein